jgi:rSAM/selenodomain-associated transferase 1
VRETVFSHGDLSSLCALPIRIRNQIELQAACVTFQPDTLLILVKPRVILFTRYPVPGIAKTRLIPAIGPDRAAVLHGRMTESIVEQLAASSLSDVDVEVRFTGATESAMRSWLGKRWLYRAQGDGDLGTRLTEAFQVAFHEGAPAVMAIGADVPRLASEILRSALDDLRTQDVVVGPTTDGGYYLIGMRAFHPELFTKIPWGTETVFERTRDTAHESGLSLGLLPKLQDIDRPEDLVHVQDLLEP